MDTTEQGSDLRPAWGGGDEGPTAEAGAPEGGQDPAQPADDPPRAEGEGQAEGVEQGGQAATGDASAAAEAPATGGQKRQSRFIAELTRAMHAAAEEGRGATLEQLRADGKTAVEGIQARSAEDAAAMRHRADEDVAGIREWSKAEIARVREETDQRIAARKETLDRELEGHAAVVEAEIESVQGQVSTFESEMDSFFQGLLAEEDPGRFAALAASMPEPPPFTPLSDAQRAEIAARASGLPAEAAGEPVPGAGPEAEAEAAVEAVDAELAPPGEVDPRLVALDLAAAERDALADVSADGQEAAGLPGGSISARLAGLTGTPTPAAASSSGEASGPESATQVIVTGLTSVSSIAAFKRQLGRLDGVRSVAVSSGPSGEFVFAVTHDSALSVVDGVRTLGGFAPEVTRVDEGVVEVTARDPEA